MSLTASNISDLEKSFFCEADLLTKIKSECPESCASGIIFPLVSELGWNKGWHGFLYMVGLLWVFLGVAIIADVFMCSIEKITSKTRRIKVSNADAAGGEEEIEVKVWNDTVANLTLMALGSSAPEILLSVIEIIGNFFEAGKLGPGTIVGSAAFNLLVITAVCVLAIPSTEVRVIRAMKVFYITAFFSVFAYVWLLVILMAVSPGIIEIWEALITLLMFPILVVLAYLADNNFFCSRKRIDDSQVELPLGFGE